MIAPQAAVFASVPDHQAGKARTKPMKTGKNVQIGLLFFSSRILSSLHESEREREMSFLEQAMIIFLSTNACSLFNSVCLYVAKCVLLHCC